MCFRMTSTCWLCLESCDSVRELKRHMGTHARLSVVCVWCPDQQKTLSRMRDLKRHANTYHPTEASEITPAFFTEGNGYWLALWPRDYCRLTTPTNYEDEVACKARELVIQWVIRVSNPSSPTPVAERMEFRRWIRRATK